MLSDVERKKREAAHFFVERLNERAGDLILKVILFGSVARGEAREESDKKRGRRVILTFSFMLKM